MSVKGVLDEKGIYRLVSAGVLTGMCLAGAGRFFGIPTLGAGHMAAAGAVLLLAAGACALRGSARAVLAAAVLICLGAGAAAAGFGTSAEFLRFFVRWEWGDMPPEAAEWEAGYELLQASLLAGGCFGLELVLERARYLKAVLAALLFGGGAVCLCARVEVSHWGAVLLLFYVVMVYVEIVQARWKKVRRGGEGQMLWLLPFLGLYLLLMAVMPVSQEPYDWRWAKEICVRIRENVLEAAQNLLRGGREDFGGSLAGFSTEASLGGSVQESGREVMTLKSRGKLKTNVYLTGKVYDTFDGRQWRQTYHGDARERFLDAMETREAVKKYDDKYLRDYLSETRLVIRYEYFNTGYVFAPLKTREVRGLEQELEMTFDGGDMLLAGQRGYGTEYEVRYDQMNAGQEVFEVLLGARRETDGAPDGAQREADGVPEEPDGVPEDSGSGYRERVPAGDAETEAGTPGGEALPEVPAGYRETIRECYLEEVTLSEGVRQRLEEITGDARGSYEILRAIEAELASYEYTRTPGDLPWRVRDESSFLDYFLLESRKGYCTYFATAFVLLARAEGIPARYVQGFCVPMQGEEEMKVYSDQAHSWPEAYLEGVGWIAFEPTPGYGGIRYTPWSPTARAEEVRESGASREESPAWEEEEPAQEEIPALPEEEEGEAGRLGRFLGVCIPALLAGCALVLAAENGFWRWWYRSRGAEERFRIQVRRNLRVLAWLGLAREEQETLQELRERGKLLQEPVPLAFLEQYEDVVYGGRAAGEVMIREACEERKEMLEMLKRRGKARYLYCLAGLWLSGYRQEAGR